MLMRSVAFLLLLLVTAASGDAPPLQQWIDEAVQAGGGVVTVPEGVHVLSKGLIIKDAKKLALRGMDKQRCVLKLDPVNGPGGSLIQILGSGETLEIANLTLEAGEGAQGDFALVKGTAAGESKITGLVVRDCLFQSFPGTGVLLEGVQSSSVERCSFRDGMTAVAFTKETTGCTALGNQVIRCQTAFDLAGAITCVLEGNEARQGTHGVLISGSRAGDVKDGHVIRNNGFFQMSALALKITEGTGQHQVQANDTE